MKDPKVVRAQPPWGPRGAGLHLPSFSLAAPLRGHGLSCSGSRVALVSLLQLDIPSSRASAWSGVSLPFPRPPPALTPWSSTPQGREGAAEQSREAWEGWWV